MAADDEHNAQVHDHVGSTLRRRRRRRRIAFSIILVALGLALFVCTRPSVLRRILEPVLASAFGGEVRLNDVHLAGFSTLVVGSLTLTAPGWPGAAGEVIRAEQVRIKVALGALLTGTVRIETLDFGLLRVRAAERTSEPGIFNVLALRPDVAAGDKPLRPLDVTLRRIELEMGTVGPDGAFRAVGQRILAGTLKPDLTRADGTLFQFALTDNTNASLTSGTPISGTLISGTWDDRTFAFACTVGSIELDRSVLDLLPIAMRQTSEAIGLTGRLRSARAAWSPEVPLIAELEVEDTVLTLRGFDLRDRWARFQDGKRVESRGLPTMRLKEGRIRYRREELVFEKLKGQLASSAEDPDLVPLPAELSLTIGLGPEALRAVDWSDVPARRRWLASFLATAPFELSVGIRGFESHPNSGPSALEVPAPVASALETFGVSSWRLDVEAVITRGAPTAGDNGSLVPAPLAMRGQALISDGRGAFDAFPYPLEGVQAHITFEQKPPSTDRVTIDYLRGTGPSGAAVTIRGSVQQFGTEAAIEVNITANETPVDDTLFNCFRGQLRAAFEMLFHRASASALEAAGLLDDSDLESLTSQARLLESRLAHATIDEASILTSDLTRVRRMIDARPFKLGGSVDLDLTVRRQQGRGQPAIVSGGMSLRRACILVAAFPYPFTVTGGDLLLAVDGIAVVGDGLRAVTRSGAAVRVQGRVGFRQDHTPGADVGTMAPDISIVAAGDRITPLLLAAIPPGKGEVPRGWPGEELTSAASLMGAARLDGTLDYRVHVTARNNEPHTAMDVQLSGGTVDVDPVSGPPLGLPAALAIDDLNATLHIEDDRITLTSVGGRVEGATDDDFGTASASGTLGPGLERDVQLRFNDVAIMPWMADVLQERDCVEARRLFETFSPGGHADASLAVRRESEGQAEVTGTITPRDLRFQFEGGEVAAQRAGGQITLNARENALSVEASQLKWTVGRDGVDGDWSIDGDATFSDGGVSDLDLRILAARARYESPLAIGIVRRTAGDSVGAAYAAARPEGRFTAEATLRSTAAHALTWNAFIEPGVLTATIGDARPQLRFEGPGVMTLSPSEIRLDKLLARVDGGTVAAEGRADLSGAQHEFVGSLRVDADQWTPEITTFLPEPLGTARRGLGFTALRLSMPAAKVRVVWDPAQGITSPSRYELKADVSASGGNFAIGVPFTSVDGSCSLDFSYALLEGAQRVKTLRADLASPSVRLYDRLVTDATAVIALEEGGDVLTVQRFDGSIAGGRVAGEASLDLRDQRFRGDVRLTEAGLAPLLSPNDTGSKKTGTVDARLSLEGVVGDISRRAGRGRIAIRDATMASSALTLRLLDLSQLALPLSTAIRAADISFFFEGPLARFERFHLETAGVDIDGRGFVDTRDFTIAAAFRSRGRMAIVRDLVGAVTDTLYEIELSGPVIDPKASLRPLPGLGRANADRAVEAP
ncbi:MAG: hypothetical protein SGJ09_12135 [Phycisphaerae bacterium]|nr:hypothetical protein [Phycisphaerae bacterium]